jgi:hypothetical protein
LEHEEKKEKFCEIADVAILSDDDLFGAHSRLKAD